MASSRQLGMQAFPIEGAGDRQRNIEDKLSRGIGDVIAIV